MSSINRRHGRLIGIAAVGALLVGAAPAAQATDWAKPATAAHRASAGRTAERSLKAAAVSACTITGYTPTKVTIGGSNAETKLVPKVTGCTLGAYEVYALPFWDGDHDKNNGWSWEGEPTAVLNPHFLHNEWTGNQTEAAFVRVWAADEDVDTVTPAEKYFDFQILRNASFSSSFDASPEPVKKGKKLTIKGTLKRINFDQAKKLGYVGYPKAAVQIQFKASGAKSFTTVSTIKAGKGGTISTRVVAKKSGTWRLYFPGNGNTSAATSGNDAVKVN